MSSVQLGTEIWIWERFKQEILLTPSPPHTHTLTFKNGLGEEAFNQIINAYYSMGTALEMALIWLVQRVANMTCPASSLLCARNIKVKKTNPPSQGIEFSRES